MMIERRAYIFIGFLFFVALGAALLNFSVEQDFSDLLLPLDKATFGSLYPSSPFTGMAVSLARTGTFNFGGPGYVGFTQRGPIYASMLAGFFLFLGERVWVVFFVNILLLWAAIFFIWRISARFLPGRWSLLPPLFLTLFWEASVFVSFGVYEMFALCAAAVSLWCFLHYHDTRKLVWLAGAAFGIGALMLEKPIVLYSIPFLVVFIVFWHWSRLSLRVLAAHACFFALIAGGMAGIWSWRNHRILDTWELGTGGVILLRRASQVDFTRSEITFMGLSFAVGDYLGAKLYDGFPRKNGLPAEPKTWDPAIERRLEKAGFYGNGGRHDWIVTDLDGEEITRVEFDRRLKKEAVAKIKEKPIKFFLVGFLNLLRLNAPINYGGQEVMHLFAGDGGLSPAAKTMNLIVIRGLWYAFLALVLYGMVLQRKNWRTAGLLAFMIFYYNGMYAFFSHAEVRYVLTVMPFYFIFLTLGIQSLYETYSTRWS